MVFPLSIQLWDHQEDGVILRAEWSAHSDRGGLTTQVFWLPGSVLTPLNTSKERWWLRESGPLPGRSWKLMAGSSLSGLSYLHLEKFKKKNKSSHRDSGLVAWHPGTPDIAACSPQGLDHSALVEADLGEPAAEETKGSPGYLRKYSESGGQDPVFGPYVAYPLAILSGAQCHPCHPMPLGMPKLLYLCSPPGPLCSHSHSPTVPHWDHQPLRAGKKGHWVSCSQ